MNWTRRAALSLLLRRGGAGIIALALAVAPLAGPAAAADLAAAKRAGLIGERPDGYVGLVRGDAPSDVRALVDRINAERRAAYEDIARRTGAPVRAVGIRAGETLIGSAPAGTYVMTATGEWIRK